MCYYQQMIRNRKYLKNKTNKGIVPTLPDRRVEYVPTSCGNCLECRKKKAREWLVRLQEDIKHHKNGKFVVLTFSNQSIKKLLYEPYKAHIRANKKKGIYAHTQIKYYSIKKTDKQTGEIQTIRLSDLQGYERDNQIATKAVRLFTEKWRKKYGTCRHWLVTELGHQGTENIHMHGVIFTDQHIDTIRKYWTFGYIWPKPWDKRPNYVNNASVNYWVKYIHKMDLQHKEYKPIILCSPGIGKDYINTNAAERNMLQMTETYKTSTGHEINLPTYYKNKLFTEADKEFLWIRNLDKGVKWVNGIPYKNDKDYDRAIQDARRKNAELKYGGRANDNRKAFEEDRRNDMIRKRTA